MSSKRKQVYEEKTVTKKTLAPPPGLKKKFRRQMQPRPMRPELKFFDTYTPLTGFVVGANYTAGVLLNGVAAGTDRNQRIGREIFIKSLRCRVSVYMPNGNPATFPTPQARFRCIAFIDKEVGAIVPSTIENVYTTRAANQIEFNTLRNMADPAKYKVLYNQPSPMMSFEGNLMGQSRHTWEFNVPINLSTKWSSTSAATVLTNLIYLYVVSEDIPSVVGIAPAYIAQTRIMFSDQ